MIFIYSKLFSAFLFLYFRKHMKGSHKKKRSMMPNQAELLPRQEKSNLLMKKIISKLLKFVSI